MSTGLLYLDQQFFIFAVVWLSISIYPVADHIHGGILDIIITNCNNAIIAWFRIIIVHLDNSISDHYLISLAMLLNFTCSSQKPLIYVYDCLKADHVNFFPSVTWLIIKNPIVTGMDYSIPKVRLRSCKYTVWFNSHIRHHSNCLRISRHKLRWHFSISNLNQWRRKFTIGITSC